MPNLKQAFCALGIAGLSTAAHADVTGVVIQGKAPNADITELNIEFKDAQTCMDFGNTLTGNYVLSCFAEDGVQIGQRICQPVQYRRSETECENYLIAPE